MKFDISIDNKMYDYIPARKQCTAICKRIAANERRMTAEDLGNHISWGHSLCPATFYHGKLHVDHFKS